MPQFTVGMKRPDGAGRKAGQKNRATLDIQQYARSIIEDPLVKTKLLEMAQRGKLHPALYREFMHYAYGRPVETVELTGADGGAIRIQPVEAEQAAEAAKARVLRLLKGGLSGNGADGNGGGTRHAAG